MIKKLFNVIKRIVFAAILIYGYNVIASPINLQIPINVFTLLLVSVLGFPSLVGLFIIVVVFFS